MSRRPCPLLQQDGYRSAALHSSYFGLSGTAVETGEFSGGKCALAGVEHPRISVLQKNFGQACMHAWKNGKRSKETGVNRIFPCVARIDENCVPYPRYFSIDHV
jgi:hypothetical protein